jgi:hypothetical protein
LVIGCSAKEAEQPGRQFFEEHFEKQLKENPTISSYNRKHYENWIRMIESQY